MIRPLGNFTKRVMQEAPTTTVNEQIAYLHDVKSKIADGLALAVWKIADTGDNPENVLRDIIKLARMLDIAAPAPRKAINTQNDPRYNLLEFIKRSSGKMVIREINGDELLFDKDRPFTCMSQVQEIFDDVYDKLSRNFTTQVQYAA